MSDLLKRATKEIKVAQKMEHAEQKVVSSQKPFLRETFEKIEQNKLSEIKNPLSQQEKNELDINSSMNERLNLLKETSDRKKIFDQGRVQDFKDSAKFEKFTENFAKSVKRTTIDFKEQKVAAKVNEADNDRGR